MGEGSLKILQLLKSIWIKKSCFLGSVHYRPPVKAVGSSSKNCITKRGVFEKIPEKGGSVNGLKICFICIYTLYNHV